MSDGTEDIPGAGLSILPNAKASVASPKVTPDENVELGDLAHKLPLHEDVMQLARLGEVGPVQKLFEDGKVHSDFTDEECITPLHVR